MGMVPLMQSADVGDVLLLLGGDCVAVRLGGWQIQLRSGGTELTARAWTGREVRGQETEDEGEGKSGYEYV